MSPLCRKSNRCAACGAIFLHCLLYAALFLGVSVAYETMDTPAVESMRITLAEAVSAPARLIEEIPPPPEETQPAAPEPLPDKVSLKPKPKPKEASKPKPRQPVQKPVAQAPEKPPALPEPAGHEPDRKAMQNAISALLASLEKEKRYPNSARRLGLEGQVFINVDLDGRGAIRSYRLNDADTHPILQKSVMQAMERVRKKWQPVEISRAVTVQIPVRFELR